MRYRDRGRSKKLPPFVPILKDMIKSPAYLQLTNASRTAYLLLKFQCKHFDQDEVKFPFSDAEKYMHRHTFRDSINQLAELGFIEKSFVGGMFRRTNIYKFIEGWKGIEPKTEDMANSIRGYNNSPTKKVLKVANKV
ncbi:MAG: hypothetical protein A2Y79_04855 [Deltaproteobacteria bacterium RBG_13_43_22]|nr:MAG: hypothetical protein A2Y79_04855 [Deltaproteobacteria bacterium RBG_13_43_22]